eukprot:13137791-Ditylum_brightwellii.AAC.1
MMEQLLQQTKYDNDNEEEDTEDHHSVNEATKASRIMAEQTRALTMGLSTPPTQEDLDVEYDNDVFMTKSTSVLTLEDLINQTKQTTLEEDDDDDDEHDAEEDKENTEYAHLLETPPCYKEASVAASVTSSVCPKDCESVNKAVEASRLMAEQTRALMMGLPTPSPIKETHSEDHYQNDDNDDYALMKR